MIIAVLASAGCYHNPDPTSWGSAAKRNFISGCTRRVDASNGTTTVVELDTREHCTCVYDAMVDTYRLDFDKMKEYEALQAASKPADSPPTPPAELTKAIKKCRPAGPNAS